MSEARGIFALPAYSDCFHPAPFPDRENPTRLLWVFLELTAAQTSHVSLNSESGSAAGARNEFTCIEDYPCHV